MLMKCSLLIRLQTIDKTKYKGSQDMCTNNGIVQSNRLLRQISVCTAIKVINFDVRRSPDIRCEEYWQPNHIQTTEVLVYRYITISSHQRKSRDLYLYLSHACTLEINKSRIDKCLFICAYTNIYIYIYFMKPLIIYTVLLTHRFSLTYFTLHAVNKFNPQIHNLLIRCQNTQFTLCELWIICFFIAFFPHLISV